NIADLGRAMGARPKAFWPGIHARKIDALVLALGRCKGDWAIEDQIAEEMTALAPKLTAHQYEWESVRLMARVRGLHRRANYVVSEVDYFYSAARPIASEWQRRIREQAAVRKELSAL